jgi:hypothetical protein
VVTAGFDVDGGGDDEEGEGDSGGKVGGGMEEERFAVLARQELQDRLHMRLARASIEAYPTSPWLVWLCVYGVLCIYRVGPGDKMPRNGGPAKPLVTQHRATQKSHFSWLHLINLATSFLSLCTTRFPTRSPPTTPQPYALQKLINTSHRHVQPAEPLLSSLSHALAAALP